MLVEEEGKESLDAAGVTAIASSISSPVRSSEKALAQRRTTSTNKGAIHTRKSTTSHQSTASDEMSLEYCDPNDNDSELDSPSNKTINRNRLGLFVCTACYTAFFAGAFLGFGPMQLMLEQDGAFASQCTANEEVEENAICAQQTASLLQVVLVSQNTSALSPALGWVADRFGSLVLVHFLSASAFLGILLVILASFLEVYALLFPGFILIGIMFVATCIMTVQTGMIFQGNTRRQAISVLNNLLDAGAVTYLVLYELSQNLSEADFVRIMLGYLGFAVLCFGGASYYWFRVIQDIEQDGSVLEDSDLLVEEKPEDNEDPFASHQLQPLMEVDEDDEGQEDAREEEDKQEASDEDWDKSEKVAHHDNNRNDKRKAMTSTKSKSSLSWIFGSMVLSHAEKQAFQMTAQTFGAPSFEKKDTTSALTTTSTTTTPEEGYQLIAKRSSQEQLKSQHYICVLLLFLCHDARTSFVAATARDFLASLGDDKHDNLYLSLFTYINVASLVALPFTDKLLETYGYTIAFQLINLLAAAHGLVQIASDNLNVQVVGFVLFSFYRSLTFSAILSYMPVFLGGATVGRGIGIMTLASGIFGLVNIPLASITVSGLGGNFLYVNLFYTIFVVPFFYVTYKIGQGIQKEQAAVAHESVESLRRYTTVQIKLNRRVSIMATPTPDDQSRRFSRMSVLRTSNVSPEQDNAAAKRSSMLDSLRHRTPRARTASGTVNV